MLTLLFSYLKDKDGRKNTTPVPSVACLHICVHACLNKHESNSRLTTFLLCNILNK